MNPFVIINSFESNVQNNLEKKPIHRAFIVQVCRVNRSKRTNSTHTSMKAWVKMNALYIWCRCMALAFTVSILRIASQKSSQTHVRLPCRNSHACVERSIRIVAMVLSLAHKGIRPNTMVWQFHIVVEVTVYRYFVWWMWMQCNSLFEERT